MDEALIKKLYRELRPMAIAFARRVPEHYDADDFIQIAMLKVVQVVERKGNTDFPYLMKIARNMMRDALEGMVDVVSLDAYLYNEETGRRHDIAERVERLVGTVTLSKAQVRYVKRMLTMSSPREQAIIQSSFGMPLRWGGHCWTVEHVCKRYGLARWQFDRLQATLVRKWRVQSPIS